jgi:hypothetical protein
MHYYAAKFVSRTGRIYVSRNLLNNRKGAGIAVAAFTDACLPL